MDASILRIFLLHLQEGIFRMNIDKDVQFTSLFQAGKCSPLAAIMTEVHKRINDRLEVKRAMDGKKPIEYLKNHSDMFGMLQRNRYCRGRALKVSHVC